MLWLPQLAHNWLRDRAASAEADLGWMHARQLLHGLRKKAMALNFPSPCLLPVSAATRGTSTEPCRHADVACRGLLQLMQHSAADALMLPRIAA